MEWKIKSPGLVLACNQELVQKGRLKPIVKMSKLGDVFSKEVYRNLNVPLRGLGLHPQPPEAMGVWGGAPSRWAIFRNFLKKKLF